MDLGYRAQYDTNTPGSKIIQDTLSFKLFSNVRFSVHLAFFDHFIFDTDFNFIPLEITPVKMYLNYTNPIAVARFQEPLTLFFKAAWETKVADFWISWSKDWFLPKFSFVDYFILKKGPVPIPQDLTTGFVFNPLLQRWKDPNSQVNLVKTFISDPSLTSLLGEHKYCDFDFINDEWPF